MSAAPKFPIRPTKRDIFFVSKSEVDEDDRAGWYHCDREQNVIPIGPFATSDECSDDAEQRDAERAADEAERRIAAAVVMA